MPIKEETKKKITFMDAIIKDHNDLIGYANDIRERGRIHKSNLPGIITQLSGKYGYENIDGIFVKRFLVKAYKDLLLKNDKQNQTVEEK